MAQSVVIETSTLINFLRIGRVDLLAGLTVYRFLLTDHVRAEVTTHYPDQLSNLEFALLAGHFHEVSLTDPPERPIGSRTTGSPRNTSRASTIFSSHNERVALPKCLEPKSPLGLNGSAWPFCSREPLSE